MRDARLYQLASTPWAIEQRKGEVLLAVLQAHSAGIERATARGAREEREARVAARAEGYRFEGARLVVGHGHDQVLVAEGGGYWASNGSVEPFSINEARQLLAGPPLKGAGAPTIAVLPLHGVMMPRGDFLSDGSGSTSLEGARGLFAEMAASPHVDAILLDIDSPGGSVYGVEEFAREIRAAGKPVIAQAWDTAASAAYWIASAADELIVTPSGVVGSIGVYEVHWDMSAAIEKAGFKPTVIKAGKFKAELSPTGPLSEEAQTFEQSQVDAYYSRFIGAVAEGRGAFPSDVESDFGQGRVFMAEQALKVGMVDRIGTFEETVGRLAADLSTGKLSALASEDARRRNARAQARLKASGV